MYSLLLKTTGDSDERAAFGSVEQAGLLFAGRTRPALPAPRRRRAPTARPTLSTAAK